MNRYAFTFLILTAILTLNACTTAGDRKILTVYRTVPKSRPVYIQSIEAGPPPLFDGLAEELRQVATSCLQEQGFNTSLYETVSCIKLSLVFYRNRYQEDFIQMESKTLSLKLFDNQGTFVSLLLTDDSSLSLESFSAAVDMISDAVKILSEASSDE
ncbi:MAG: hypothetical protein PQJ61_08120 [Spirochaetales bacterium]|uniref:Uncharacterized protein n=1 Tax=Candidatus Thalassospirochaeta sargassi TaxID=3119039 RepID=A0AAJ1II90_9SPIO|nr:hypothetical protein [Spirochaetales bacterium]